MSVEDFSEAMRRRNSPTGDWRDGLSRTEDGAPRKNLFNACVALRDHPALQGRISYDEFRGATWARVPLPWNHRADRPWSDFDDLKATEWLQSPEIGILVGSGIVREAVQAVAHESRFHPVLEWLEGLQWDGTERLSSWLTTYMGVPSSPLSDAFGRKFLISAVARVMRPGCNADHMLILEGQQGIMKSKSLHVLAGDWFADQIADLGTKDSCQDLRGVWIIELSELSAIRPGEVERVKAYISRQVDHYRPSYGRRSIDVPRQCVFIGTTNAHEYLSDATGGRRFWPVTCTKIDVEAIAKDRAQLWSEAVAAFHAGETWWLDDGDLRRLAEAEQEQRRIADPWEEIVNDWLEHPTKLTGDGIRVPLELEDGRVTNAQILEHAIAKPTERQTTSDQMRVGRILARLGWKKRRIGKAKVMCWEQVDTPSDSAETRCVYPGVSTPTPRPRPDTGQAAHLDTPDSRTHGVVGGRFPEHPTVEVCPVCPPPEKTSERQGVTANCRVDTPAKPERERIGSCVYCFDAAYDDNADHLRGGGVLHYRCTTAWTRSQPQ
jgi:putative DNA primase/helicase